MKEYRGHLTLRRSKSLDEIEGAEKILGGILLEKESAFFNLYFTSKRIIVAKSWQYSSRDIIKGEVFGLLSFEEKLLPKAQHMLKEMGGKLQPENILSMNEENFEILYSDITKIELKKKRVLDSIVKIYTDHEVLKISVSLGFKHYIKLISSILPEKIHLI